MVRFGFGCAQVLVPDKTVFIVFPLLQSIKVGIGLSCLTPPTQSRAYLLSDYAGGLSSMLKIQCFYGKMAMLFLDHHSLHTSILEFIDLIHS